VAGDLVEVDLHADGGGGPDPGADRRAAPVALVVGTDGQVLFQSTQVVSVVVSAQRAGNLNSVAHTLAGPVPVRPTITAQSITAGATAAGSGGYPVAVLRSSDYLQVKPVIYNLPGVTFPSQTQLVAAQRGFGAALLPTMRTLARDADAANSGITLFVKNADGSQGDTVFTTRP